MAAASPAPFSRLQLAAALLEYDNDPTNPDAPQRSAQESAIFANFRRARPRQNVPKRNDYLSVALPSETGSVGGRESVLSGRRSRSSINMLRNPFGAEETGEYEDDEEDNDEEAERLEVDLSSWGLDAFMTKETAEAKNSKRRSRTSTLPNPQPVVAMRSPTSYAGETPARTTRSMSVGNLDQMTNEIEAGRRKSFGSPLDLERTESIPLQRPRAASHSLVPFPSESVRSPSPPRQEDFRSSVFTSKFEPRSSQDEDQRTRRMSVGSMNSRYMLTEDNPFALRPPTSMSKFDPKAAAHARTMSNASMGSRMMLDDASVMTGQARDGRYSTMELLRPKVLVMPSPLQPPSGIPPPEPTQAREGFSASADPPLPPGARASRRMSSTLMDSSPSNLFTPNPRMNLTLSQLTFRNTLMVGGQRDVAYSDLDAQLPRAAQEGEQVQQTPPITEDEALLQTTASPEDQVKPGRPPGKLYGKSLIDDLEGRKAAMRSKQRVFTGDARPSMMARTSAQRKSTLIDLDGQMDEQGRPLVQLNKSFDSQGSQNALGRRNSLNAKPLLNFDDDDKLKRGGPGLGPNSRPNNSRSVFGVDTLWEREMVKLKEIEAREKEEQELMKAQEEARESKKRGRKKRKDKLDVDDISPAVSVSPSVSDLPQSDAKVASSPPVLPAISPGLRRPPPANDSDSEDSVGAGPSQPQAQKRDGWVSSDDEGDGPTRKPGTGPRYPARAKVADQDNDSEEDMPLAATIDRAAQRVTQMQLSADPDSDEEQPLSALLRKSKLSLPSLNFDRQSQNDDEEDDKPLGLRASRVAPSFLSSRGGEEDDDMPLAYHPEQQRRSQYHMMAQAQQQHQQQMMMQAQFTNSMFFSPPAMPAMMGSGFFAPPMMMPPSPMAPVHDEAKYGAVDKWRRDVVLEDGQ
ncbi:hypothetical protein MIND_00731700 [Mycena indigotica]|uniref:Uncharacterized protein n=1 Tax=Mycena indigotica TaxID=2126181 RepID=A0A8H6SNU2_9AGAR|nr:uncharacterized protein MIND_00731700 [Mycena indigotica]KAF7301662.1 hypothetical protein MIND_00731700 [Mycena indigotica]